MRCRCACLALFLSFAATAGLHAQRSPVWEGGKSALGRARQQAGRTASGMQRLKKRLSEWGLDTNYNRSLSLGGRLNSDGWSGRITYGRKRGAGGPELWQLSVSEVKHEKETKLQGNSKPFPELGRSTPFIFGKQNNLYLLQLTYSRELSLLPALLEGHVAIGVRYGGGLTLALLKPYYLKLIYPDQSGTPASASLREESYTDGNSERFLNPSLILGRAAWSKGLDRMQYLPGLHVECAIVITPAAKRVFAQTITLGAQAMIATDAMPLLINNTADRYRGCLFAGLELGKRWRK